MNNNEIKTTPAEIVNDQQRKENKIKEKIYAEILKRHELRKDIEQLTTYLQIYTKQYEKTYAKVKIIFENEYKDVELKGKAYAEILKRPELRKDLEQLTENLQRYTKKYEKTYSKAETIFEKEYKEEHLKSLDENKTPD